MGFFGCLLLFSELRWKLFQGYEREGMKLHEIVNNTPEGQRLLQEKKRELRSDGTSTTKRNKLKLKIHEIKLKNTR